MKSPSTPELHIDVYVDVICPWCLIGKRQLDRALQRFTAEPDAPPVHVRWNSVQLLPQTPLEGLDYTTFYEQRLGGAQAVRMRQAQVRQAAASAGLDLQFARIQRFPNTRLAHQLLSLARNVLSPASQRALLDDVMCAYFQRGVDIGNADALQALAQRHGLNAEQVTEWLQSGQGVPEPVHVPGVPFFVFNNKQALSGAQTADVLLNAMVASLAPTHATADAL